MAGRTKATWPEPKSFDEAEERIDALLIEARLIEAQLGDRNRTSETGERLSDVDYNAWRAKAAFAMALKRGEVDFLKGWRRRRQREFDRMVVAQDFRLDPAEPASLLFGLYSVVHHQLAGQPLTQRDQRLIDLVASVLRDKAHGAGGDLAS